MNLVVCPICAVVDTQEEYPDAAGPASTWPLVRCRRCALVFQREMPSFEQLDQAQGEAYGKPTERFSPLLEKLIRLFRGSRARLASRHMPTKGRVLDVGCGRGLFLKLMRERGHEVRGTELSAATAANAYPDVPIDPGDLDPGNYEPASFDLVSIWHVLEHIRHPDQTLHAAATLLKPGGTLLLAVPNYASRQARLGGEHWFHLDLPRHLFHFTPPTLERLIQNAGLTPKTLRTGQWEMDPFGLLQTSLNRTGLRHNALYDTLRNHPTAKADLSLPTRLALLALFPLGMALTTPLSLLFRLTNRAGTLIATATR